MKKLNNKILFIVLLGLALVYVATKYFRAGRESNLPENLVILDTAAVTEVKIYPKLNDFKEIRLYREASGWKVYEGDQSSNTESGYVSTMLASFPLKPLELISTKSEKWDEYQVGDTATRVAFYVGDKEVGGLVIGRLGYVQQPGQQFGAGGVQTYVRVDGENEVYAVQGYLGTTFDRNYNDWRDKTLMQLNANDITKISFNYPADSGYVMQRADSVWLVGTDNNIADSTKVANFLSQLNNKRGVAFVDDYVAPQTSDMSIQFYNNLSLLAELKGWKRADDWVIQSNSRPEDFFTSQGLESLLKSKADWTP